MAKFIIWHFRTACATGPNAWLVRPFLVFTFICQDNATKIWRKLFGLRDSSLQRVKSVTGLAQCKSGKCQCTVCKYCTLVCYVRNNLASSINHICMEQKRTSQCNMIGLHFVHRLRMPSAYYLVQPVNLQCSESSFHPGNPRRCYQNARF